MVAEATKPGASVDPPLVMLIIGCDDGESPTPSGAKPGMVRARSSILARSLTTKPPTRSSSAIVSPAFSISIAMGILNEWQMPQWKLGKPVGLSVGPDGNLWVPDTHYHRVVVYTPTGEKLREFGSFGPS